MNPESDNFIGNKISNAILEGLKFLFVPDTEEIEIKFNQIKDKFAFFDDVKATIEELQDTISADENSSVFYITVVKNKWFDGQVQVINLEWYKPYKQYGDAIFCCFAYGFFFWRIFIKMASIINGAGGSIDIFKEGENKR